jgi:aminoacyl tRNA synthase complex-interacting multifunctional protein 1
MELFVNSNESSFFLELLATYTHSTEKQLIRVLKVREITQNLLKLPDLPILVTNTGEIIRDEKEICELIAKLTSQYKNLIGQDETQAHSNFEFIQYIKQQKGNKARLAFLNKHLTLNTFCNGFHITIADLYAFACVLPDVISLSDDDKVVNSNVVRWVHHIQSLKGLKECLTKSKMTCMLPFEPLYLDAETKVDDKAAGKKKEDAKPKEKKETAKKPAAEDDVHAISKLDIRVGKIVEINVNTESEKLYNERIDIGGGEIRTIASGLQKKVPIESLRDSLVVVLCNLKPRALCGWNSHGMLLCATDDKDNTEPIRPPAGSQPGDAVTIGDFPRLPVPELNPKKSPWDVVKDQLLINEDKVATYDLKHEWKTDKGLITSENFTKAKIS